MTMTNDIKKMAPRFIGVNRSGTLNLRSRAWAAEFTEALRAVLAARGPTTATELWHLLGAPTCLSRAQIHRLLKKAKEVRMKRVFHGGVIENISGVNGDRRWKPAMQAFYAGRGKAHSDKSLVPEEQERKPMGNAENIRSPPAARRARK